jgi:hypothetical protein
VTSPVLIKFGEAIIDPGSVRHVAVSGLYPRGSMTSNEAVIGGLLAPFLLLVGTAYVALGAPRGGTVGGVSAPDSTVVDATLPEPQAISSPPSAAKLKSAISFGQQIALSEAEQMHQAGERVGSRHGSHPIPHPTSDYAVGLGGMNGQLDGREVVDLPDKKEREMTAWDRRQRITKPLHRQGGCCARFRRRHLALRFGARR